MYRVLAIIVALIVYGSLYPWNFTFVNLRSLSLDELLFIPRLSRSLARDFVFNIALYVPVGVVAQLAFRQHLRTVWSCAAAVVLGASVSFMVEMLQQTQPHRTSGILDVYANGLGSALGALVSLAAVRLSARHGRLRPRARTKVAAIALLACLAALYLFPFVPSINIAALPSKFAAFASLPLYPAIRFTNVLMAWFAAGLLLSHLQVRRVWLWLGMGIAFIPAQVFLSRRQPTILEMGAAAGGALLYALCKTRGPKTRAALYGTLLVVRALLPAGTAEVEFLWTPFRSVMEGDWHSGTLVLMEKAYLYGAGVWVAGKALGGLAYSTLAVASLLAVLEAVQVGLPGRTPEITDPLIAILVGFSLHAIADDMQGRTAAAVK